MYELLQEGSIVLAQIEANGMRVDVDYLDRMIALAQQKIDCLEHQMKESNVWQMWKDKYQDTAKLGSRKQLGEILFGEMRLACSRWTPIGRAGTSETDLEGIDHPFVRQYVRVGKLRKLQATYLCGIRRELEDDGFLHPFFHLNLTTSGRSSSSNPNYQNLPARDLEFTKVIRRAFVPREGHVLVEVDMVAAEVRISACYHKDPTMLKYLRTGRDLHADMAAQCFKLPMEQITKAVRHTAKNGFVFPEFFGDYYVQVAQNMWNMIRRHQLKTVDGKPLEEHLSEKDIHTYEEFQRHIQLVEEDFWNRRFPIYARWKRKWWEQYLERGWFQSLTGFVSTGVYTRNEATNLPVQGTSFHCLLWSLVQLQHWLLEHKMRSKIIGEIHDSMVIDVHREELDEVIGKTVQIMTRDLLDTWEWIIVPMEVEVHIAETNWYEKKEVDVKNYTPVEA